MKRARIQSASEQLCDVLREEVLSGKWTDTMPGVQALAKRMEVGYQTVRSALAQLEEEGILQSQGRGRRRRILQPSGQSPMRSLRIRILLYEKNDRFLFYNVMLLSRLLQVGFIAEYADQSLKQLGMNVSRVARYVEKNPADAWVVSAASREVNEWFSRQPTPAIAKFGRFRGLPIAAAHTNIIPVRKEIIQHLLGLGHERIVMVTREERRVPKLSQPEQVFIDELEAAGIATGPYNVPEWKENKAGLIALLDQLFQYSPPTAMIFQEPAISLAASTYLAARGIIAPRDISLVNAQYDPSFSWTDPTPTHLEIDFNMLVRRIVRWAQNIARGKNDRRQFGIKVKFIKGGTTGPVPKVSHRFEHTR